MIVCDMSFREGQDEQLHRIIIIYNLQARRAYTFSCILFKFFRPLPGRVEHAQNLDLFAFYSVWHDIGQSWNNQLQCPSHAP
jgi:hypothetical protein